MSQPRERAKHSTLGREFAGTAVVLSLAAVLAEPDAVSLAVWALYAAVAYRAAARSGEPRFGWAHRVTLLRGLLVALMISVANEPWLPVVLGAVALALDGVDGPIARRTGTASGFGARFDMETDALTVLALSALVAAEGRVGPWVLLSGAMRYLYVAAGWLWPRLARPVPPSFARKLVCVLQIAGLLVALLPILPPPWPTTVSAVALALLAWSFGRDILWLMRDQGMAESSAAPYLPRNGGV